MSVAVVTGGSGAIGRAILSRLREDGFTALSLDLTEADVECDVRDESSLSRAIDHVVTAHGTVAVAVHAAGVTRDGVVWKLKTDDWDLVHSVNLRGAFLLLRLVIPVMRAAGDGRIVFIGSVNGSRGKFGASAYSASKAGMIGLAKSVARETGRFGIRVNVVEPGWVRTPLTESLPASFRQKALDETLLGEFVQPGDVANAVAWLAGPGAARVTGQVVRVDAGQFV